MSDPAVSQVQVSGRNARGLWPERYEFIDAWRGLAALAVVLHHVAQVNVGGPAVMLFFVISGYCIAASVDSCERKGLGFGRFMMRRVRRIYPPYLLSIVFWSATRYIKLKQTGVNDFAKFGPLEWVQNITLTQWLTLMANPVAYAATNKTLFVAVYWSLCYEEQFYLVMGLMMLLTVVLKMSVLTMTTGLLGVGLVVNAAFPEVSCGLFIEYWALFAIGVLVFHRLCRIRSEGGRRAVDGGLVALLVASVYLRWFSGVEWSADNPMLTHDQRAETRIVYGELAIASGFALVLIVMRPLSTRVSSLRLYKPLMLLGTITFSLYLIHQFNLNLIAKVAGKMLAVIPVIGRGVVNPEKTWYGLTLQIALHIALASVFWFFCERPFLNKPLISERKPPREGSARAGDLPPSAGSA